jgi:hypothetical protein
MEDFELLQRCGSGRVEDAFALAVPRHLHLVYAAAPGRTREPPSAAEVAQVVVIRLARNAAIDRSAATHKSIAAP